MMYEKEIKEEQAYIDLVMETRRQFGKITEAEYTEYKEEQKKK